MPFSANCYQRPEIKNEKRKAFYKIRFVLNKKELSVMTIYNYAKMSFLISFYFTCPAVYPK